jgi:hypothetical protein
VFDKFLIIPRVLALNDYFLDEGYVCKEGALAEAGGRSHGAKTDQMQVFGERLALYFDQSGGEGTSTSS